MMYAQGGTNTYCPHCKTIEICKAVNPGTHGYEAGAQFHKQDHKDVFWRRRVRICQNCNQDFATAELDEDFVDELVELRDALAKIKIHAEAYAEQSSAASKSLSKLSTSLRVLRALELYKKS